MALQEEFERSGNWLFRWRSFLPLAMIAVCLAALSDYHLPGNSEVVDHYWEGFCLAVSFFGLGIRAMTIGYTPGGTSGRNTREQVAESLNTSGMYSVVRNPLYLGNFFMALGIALFPHQLWLAIIYVLAYWLYYERIIFAEEAFLRRKFGEDYLAWANATPVFFPKWRQYRKADLPFSIRNVLKREYNGLFAVIAVMFVMEMVGDWFAEGILEFDVAWLVMLGTGLAIWLPLRVLKKYSTLLHVEGR